MNNNHLLKFVTQTYSFQKDPSKLILSNIKIIIIKGGFKMSYNFLKIKSLKNKKKPTHTQKKQKKRVI